MDAQRVFAKLQRQAEDARDLIHNIQTINASLKRQLQECGGGGEDAELRRQLENIQLELKKERAGAEERSRECKANVAAFETRFKAQRLEMDKRDGQFKAQEQKYQEGLMDLRAVNAQLKEDVLLAPDLDLDEPLGDLGFDLETLDVDRELGITKEEPEDGTILDYSAITSPNLVAPSTPPVPAAPPAPPVPSVPTAPAAPAAPPVPSVSTTPSSRGNLLAGIQKGTALKTIPKKTAKALTGQAAILAGIRAGGDQKKARLIQKPDYKNMSSSELRSKIQAGSKQLKEFAKTLIDNTTGFVEREKKATPLKNDTRGLNIESLWLTSIGLSNLIPGLDAQIALYDAIMKSFGIKKFDQLANSRKFLFAKSDGQFSNQAASGLFKAVSTHIAKIFQCGVDISDTTKDRNESHGIVGCAQTTEGLKAVIVRMMTSVSGHAVRSFEEDFKSEDALFISRSAKAYVAALDNRVESLKRVLNRGYKTTLKDSAGDMNRRIRAFELAFERAFPNTDGKSYRYDKNLFETHSVEQTLVKTFHNEHNKDKKVKTLTAHIRLLELRIFEFENSADERASAATIKNALQTRRGAVMDDEPDSDWDEDEDSEDEYVPSSNSGWRPS